MQSDFYRALEAAQQALCASPHPAATAHELADAAAARSQARAPWACARGCASCCSFPVGLTFDEAVGAVAALRASPHAERLEAAVRRDHVATRSRPWLELAGRPCPLLREAACAVYDARPLPCRALGSRDADACERSARGEAVPVPTADDAFAAGLALGQALDAVTGDLGHRELRSALAALLTCAPGREREAFVGARRVHADGIDDSAPACGAR